MRAATRNLVVAGAFVWGAGLAVAQNSNNSTFSNGSDVFFFYSDPSSGATSGAAPADITGDLYWRTHTGGNFLNDVDAALGGSLMEIDGYYEELYDTDWSTTPHFYVRAHVFEFQGTVPDLTGYGAGTSGVTVVLGPSGFGPPCTVAPSICSPLTTGAICATPSFVVGWLVDITFGSGIVVTAAGIPGGAPGGNDIATVWFVTGGMITTGGTCGAGDYAMQDAHSTDETQADVAGGLNLSGGFQIAGGGLAHEGVASMAEGHETWRNNIVNVRANTLGGGVEAGNNGGGAMNGRNLSVGAGGSALGVELRDLFGSGGPNIGIVGASLTPLPNPGVPALGGNLLVLPDGLFNSTSAIWQGPVAPITYVFTAEGAFTGAQLPVPTTAAGATLHIQGATFSLATFTVNSTNQVTTFLAP